jgi:ankyrin repeat protein
MLAHGGNIHTRPRHGLSLIMLAAASGNAALLELLLAKGASARDRGDHGHTVMYLAVSNRHAEVAERLIAAGADVNVGYNDSTLLMACKDAQIGALLLDHGADASLRDSHGRDAAFHACIDGATDMVSLFIDRGVNVFSISDSGLTGLMCACSNGHVEVAVVLLQAKGVTQEWVNAVSEDGDTALFFAVSHVLSGECLDSEDIYVDPAVSEHHTSTTCKMTKMLLDAGAEDLPLINGRTGLMEACECGNDGLAKLLLEYNSDINAVDDDGFTALTLGIRRVKIARVLLEADPPADVNFRLPMNNTALFAGAGEFVPDAIKMLLKAGADPRVVADNGCVALMNAADGETVSALIEAAPDTVNQRDECGRTVFHYYSSVGNKCSALQQLCKYMQSSDQQIDININDKDDNGDTALHMPMMYANKATLDLLLENGADVFVTGYEGSTVLMKPFFDDDLVSEVYDDLDVRIFEPEEESEEDRKEADEAISLCLKTVIERILPEEDRDKTVSQDGAEGDEETAAKRRRLLKWQALLE